MKITKEEVFTPFKLTIEIESVKDLEIVNAILNTRATISNCVPTNLRFEVSHILQNLTDKLNQNGN